MIPVLSADQVRQWDHFTIQHEPISTYALMERAVTKLTRSFTAAYPVFSYPSACIVIGPGNNGGDGLGLARHLYQSFYQVCVWIINEGKSPDNKRNYQLIQQHPGIRVAYWPAIPEELESAHVIVDALLGTGFTGVLKNPYPEVLKVLNRIKSTKVAIDIPTGMNVDSASAGITFLAHHTLALQCPKSSFFLAKESEPLGKWELLDIGLQPEYLLQTSIATHLIETSDIRSKFKIRSTFSHKGTFGHALVIAGSQGKMGAALLAGEACLRTGAGKLTIHIPQNGNTIIQSGLREGMVSLDPHVSCWTEPPPLTEYQAVGIGCGIGTNRLTANALFELISQCQIPLVLDADALNLLVQYPKNWNKVPSGTILTPHPGEFARIVGVSNNGFEEMAQMRAFCKKHDVIMILKGAYTKICIPSGQIYINPTGNPGMATAGSGDVLTGIITGLLAQGYIPMDAAMIGVFIHGLAGDLALTDVGAYESLIAGDIIRNLGKAFDTVKANINE
jgi:hydroxyethylthiazole kinase-like uncharacterized protein yjeF